MIEVNQLTKRFTLSKEAKKQVLADQADIRQEGQFFHALTNVSFSCLPGQVLGLLGPNGAGKTTTLRILSSAIKPSSGQIFINDVDVLKNQKIAKQSIGFLSSKTGLYARLTAQENIEYFAKLHGMNKQQINEVAPLLYSQLGIEDYLHRRVESLSSGMLQKVSIARAVIHQPKVLILDEPTTGLDIMATDTLLTFIEQQKQLGRPIIFSTHHLDEVAQLADSVAIIQQGRSCFNGSIHQLQQYGGSDNLRAAFMHILQKTEVHPS